MAALAAGLALSSSIPLALGMLPRVSLSAASPPTSFAMRGTARAAISAFLALVIPPRVSLSAASPPTSFAMRGTARAAISAFLALVIPPRVSLSAASPPTSFATRGTARLAISITMLRVSLCVGGVGPLAASSASSRAVRCNWLDGRSVCVPVSVSVCVAWLVWPRSAHIAFREAICYGLHGSGG